METQKTEAKEFTGYIVEIAVPTEAKKYFLVVNHKGQNTWEVRQNTSDEFGGQVMKAGFLTKEEAKTFADDLAKDGGEVKIISDYEDTKKDADGKTDEPKNPTPTPDAPAPPESAPIAPAPDAPASANTQNESIQNRLNEIEKLIKTYVLKEEKVEILNKTYTAGPDSIVDDKGNTYGWDIISAFYKYGKEKGWIKETNLEVKEKKDEPVK